MRKKKKAVGEKARPFRLHMLLSGYEHGLLAEICDEYGLTMSDAIRLLIRKEYAQIGGKKPIEPLTPRKNASDNSAFLTPERRR
jgi:hypothetical protein